ncbi:MULTISPECIES: alpha-ketoacid dehydrogenase subunit beta [unclassified Saccharopolyspora]|uniref:alpha-ketoacid dehydrogenase subunit beta n=1 Tax=unclassified Saccharopolyspora TaxID=2646250 RepID=UPI001CD61AC4|nr:MULTISPECIES: alpha-ketoacid dehydrogenase subunit beta [unclassified Saccharopolyspora]MCA1189852.1 alpha-ketoacid dehydrogenase subunit beta [Saccharopolyspora sp. 6T]MCA1196036.1 alpha-ketoacid dehydrogenase subunit beta [Saccharopolyspora sp. 6V]MCA1229512.1 alpha-ketoacid dehydrogenase subunit beta [Saccharopolyspora sp. 6M]MCA1283368.1 alpha-ketoacid dehydrogenase subunit beta [Saccharopolyspora sp. 7B]
MAAPAMERTDVGDGSTGRSAVQTVTMAKSLNLAMRSALESDPKVLVMGEDVGKLGGVFRVTDGLQKDFGEHRVLDTPLAESGIIGTAVGLAIRGYRPVCEIQFDGFIFPGYDQIVSQLAKLHFRSQGKVKMPVVVRVPFGGGIGAVEHHSESPESLFAHVAGVKVVACSNPADAYWMLRQAIACDDPVLFFEPKRRYYEKAELDTEAQPPPLFTSRVLRRGSAATIATYGPTVHTCLAAASAAAEEGTELEVVDLRSLSPLDLEPVFESVRRTGRLVLASEAPAESSVTSEIAARVQQECFYSLEAPVLRVTGFDVPYPPTKLEKHYLPDLDRVLDAVDRSLAF